MKRDEFVDGLVRLTKMLLAILPMAILGLLVAKLEGKTELMDSQFGSVKAEFDSSAPTVDLIRNIVSSFNVTRVREQAKLLSSSISEARMLAERAASMSQATSDVVEISKSDLECREEGSFATQLQFSVQGGVPLIASVNMTYTTHDIGQFGDYFDMSIVQCGRVYDLVRVGTKNHVIVSNRDSIMRADYYCCGGGTQYVVRNLEFRWQAALPCSDIAIVMSCELPYQSCKEDTPLKVNDFAMRVGLDNSGDGPTPPLQKDPAGYIIPSRVVTTPKVHRIYALGPHGLGQVGRTKAHAARMSTTNPSTVPSSPAPMQLSRPHRMPAQPSPMHSHKSAAPSTPSQSRQLQQLHRLPHRTLIQGR